MPTAPYAATPSHQLALESKGVDWELELAKPQTVEEMVTAEFKDAPVMVSIARAESKFDPKAKNPNSTATGVFQILIGTWNDPYYGCVGERTNAEDNIDCARKIYEKSGTVPWNSSSAHW